MARRRTRRAKRRRGRRRARRRNTWFGHPRLHRKAAKKGWRRRRRRKGRKRKATRRRSRACNPRRRRSTRRRRRNAGRRRRRSRRRNPATLSLRKPVGTITAGFNVKTLTKAAVITSGALGNAWLSGAVGSFLPGFLQTGIGSYVTGLASAGVLGAGVGMVSPRLAGDVFFGGVLEVVTRAAKEYVVPMLPGMSGLGDYLTVQNARDARNLHGYMGDYLTVQNARDARALGYTGDYYGDSFVQEELAAY